MRWRRCFAAKFIDIVSGKTAEADFGAMFEVPVDTMPESVPAESGARIFRPLFALILAALDARRR